MDNILTFKQILPEKYFMEFWGKNTRSDQRNFNQIREIKVDRIDQNLFVLNFGGNVVQCSHEIAKSKMYQTQNQNIISTELVATKLVFSLENYPNNNQIESLKCLLIEFFQKHYSQFFGLLKWSECLKISVQNLTENGNPINALILSILLKFYLFNIEANTPILPNMPIFVPILVAGFFVPEKNAVQWVVDPNADESNLTFFDRKACSVLVFVNIITKKTSVIKLSGFGISTDDLISLQALVENSCQSAIQNFGKMLQTNNLGFYKIN